jgi:hypothetical protein
MGFYVPAESTVSVGSCSADVFEREIRPVLDQPSGLAGQLNTNLKLAGVDRVVRVSLGDFRDLETRPYRFVFCDAMHDEVEIRRNAPDLRRFLDSGSILACHDTSDANAKLLRQVFDFGDFFRADSLFVGLVAHV